MKKSRTRRSRNIRSNNMKRRRINHKEEEKEVKWRMVSQYLKPTKGKSEIYEKNNGGS